MNDNQQSPQVKICGLTRVGDAQFCVAMGASAIGCVFYPPSPRHITLDQARRICAALPATTVTVGVFVNASFEHIMATVKYCSLKAVQLHGQEPKALAQRLRQEKLTVIKALFSTRQPYLNEADQYDASAFLVEYGQGRMPGGNAETWPWQEARDVGRSHPLILAGGLSPDNVHTALAGCEPDAVDVSSGVESSPGHKDIDRVRSFIDAVKRYRSTKQMRRIF